MEALVLAQEVQLTLLSLWGTVVGFLPQLIGALFIVVVGLIFAPIFGGAVKKLVDVLRIDELARKVGVHEMAQGYTDNFSISLIIGKLVKWFFILVSVMAAAEILDWTQVTAFLNQIILYIPSVLIAIIFLLFAIIAGKFFEAIVVRSLRGANAPVERPEVLGAFTRWSFMVFGIFAAMIQLGIAESLITILFAGFVLAMALSFGLGGRKKAEELLDLVKVGCGSCGDCKHCKGKKKK